MSHRPTILTASVLLSLLALTGCSGGSTPSAGSEPVVSSTETTSAAETAAAVEPDIYKARVIDVLSGDTLRVQLVEAVYTNGVSGSGKREEVELDEETITVKDPTFDAPAEGECGFEESRSHMHTEVLNPLKPGWVPGEDSKVIIELNRTSIEDLPAADGEVQFYRFNNQWSPATTMLTEGYAQVGELVPVETEGNTLYTGLAGWEKQAREAVNEDDNLWDTCWAE